jgi:hypothetical protein
VNIKKMGWQNKQQECLRISEKKMFYIMVTLPFEFVIVSGPLKPLCGSVATWKKYLYVHFYCGYCPNSSSVNEKYTNLKHYIISSVYKKDPWDFFKATYFVAVVWNVKGQWKAHQLTFFLSLPGLGGEPRIFLLLSFIFFHFTTTPQCSSTDTLRVTSSSAQGTNFTLNPPLLCGTLSGSHSESSFINVIACCWCCTVVSLI